jgi:hypothetical protein
MKKFLCTMFTLGMLALPSFCSAYTVILQWTANPVSENVTKYTVYNAATKAVLATVIPPNNNASIPGLTGPITFYVTASNNLLESPASNIVSILAAMTNIKAVLAAGTITFTWDSVPGAVEYQVHDGSTQAVIQRISAPALTASISGAVSGKLYWLSATGPTMSTMPTPLIAIPSVPLDLKVNSLTIGP